MSRRSPPKAALALILTMILVNAGCSGESSTSRNSDTEGKEPAVSFTPVSFPVWREKLASWHGDIVVVDVWATWCLPCLERFPHMVDLHERFGGQGVKFVSLSLDDRGDRAAVAREKGTTSSPWSSSEVRS